MRITFSTENSMGAEVVLSMRQSYRLGWFLGWERVKKILFNHQWCGREYWSRVGDLSILKVGTEAVVFGFIIRSSCEGE